MNLTLTIAYQSSLAATMEDFIRSKMKPDEPWWGGGEPT